MKERSEKSRWKRYPKYKDSGVEWLGEIPEGWVLTHLGYESSLIVPMRDKPTRFDGSIPWIRIEDFAGKYISDSKSGQMVSSELIKEMNLKVYPPGTVLCSCSCTMGCTAIVTNPLISNQTFIGIIPGKGILSDFLYYFLKSGSAALQSIGSGAIQQYLSREEFSQFSLSLPPLPEQTAIASFLDRETARIDALIEKKQRQIELLQEKRAALISQAVTKGLDPTVPMKNSGVPWLGEVPEHWEVTKVKFVLESLDHRRIPLSSEERADMDKKYPYYGASGIIDYVEDYLFDEPLLLVSEDGANLLSRSTPLAFIANGEYWVNNHAHILKPKFGKLFYWEGVLKTFDYTPLITGAAQPKLTADNLSSIEIPSPSVDEQTQIVDYLREKLEPIYCTINKITYSIERLSEFRSALISAAVTGKIDVRAEAEA